MFKKGSSAASTRRRSQRIRREPENRDFAPQRAIEDLGKDALPIHRTKEAREFSYVFIGTEKDAATLQPGRYCEGPSLDGQEFSFRGGFEPLGQEPVLGPARPDSGAQVEQMEQAPFTHALT